MFENTLPFLRMQEGEVWAPDATHGFIKGTVVEIGSDTLTVQTPDNAVSLYFYFMKIHTFTRKMPEKL